jgi:hypothetical protein
MTRGHRTFNHGVEGSSPPRSANKIMIDCPSRWFRLNQAGWKLTGCWMEQKTIVEADEAAPQTGEQIIVKTYTGSQAEATMSFQADAARMAAQGYFPVFQSWAPGQWRPRAFIAALLLCFLIVGIPALIYMLIVTPDGALTVTYGLRGASVDEKI